MIISRGENAGDAGGTRTDDDEQSEMQNGIAVFLHGIGIEARKDRHLRADRESLFLGRKTVASSHGTLDKLLISCPALLFCCYFSC